MNPPMSQASSSSAVGAAGDEVEDLERGLVGEDLTAQVGVGDRHGGRAELVRRHDTCPGGALDPRADQELIDADRVSGVLGTQHPGRPSTKARSASSRKP